MSRSNTFTSLFIIASLAAGCASDGAAIHENDNPTPEADPNAQHDPTSDGDSDGLPADQDLCPGTAAGSKVDGNGLVSVRGKGTTRIQVSDSRGDSLSYEVSVTGVIHCLGLGSGSFTTVSNAAGQQGARLCSLDELREIHAAYGNRWPMGNANVWSSSVAMQNLVGWKWYFVKNLVNGGEYKLLHHNPSLGVAIR